MPTTCDTVDKSNLTKSVVNSITVKNIGELSYELSEIEISKVMLRGIRFEFSNNIIYDAERTTIIRE